MLTAGFSAVHILALIGVGIAKIEPPMALETIQLDLVAQGVPMPEPVTVPQEPPPEPELEKETTETTLPPEPPPVTEVKAAEILPQPLPKPQKPKPRKKRPDHAASSVPQRVGLPQGRSQEAGMSRATYGALVIAQIQARKFYPAAARDGGIRGIVGVSFIISGSGSTNSVVVTSSSGSTILDAAAKQIVRSIHLPPPPGGSFSGSTKLAFSLAR